jgi:hypothetical protein
MCGDCRVPYCVCETVNSLYYCKLDSAVYYNPVNFIVLTPRVVLVSPPPLPSRAYHAVQCIFWVGEGGGGGGGCKREKTSVLR